MITREEYEEAQNIVWDYENQIMDEMEDSSFHIEYVVDYINEEKLNQKVRSRDYSYRRFYMCKYLAAKFDLKQKEIGFIMNRDHSSVCSAIKAHDNLTETNDKEYESRTREIRRQFKL